MTQDRRAADLHTLSSWMAQHVAAAEEFERRIRHEDGSGLFTVPAIMLFVRFLIDVSQQTSVNEFQVFPACLVTLTVDEVERRAAQGPLGSDAITLLGAVAETLVRTTRRADKAGRLDERTFVLLLTRTTARSVRDHYVVRISDYLRAASAEAGVTTGFSFGIASLTEHVIRDPDDLLRKSLRALQAAERREETAVERGPAVAAMYDVRTMPLDLGGGGRAHV